MTFTREQLEKMQRVVESGEWQTHGDEVFCAFCYEPSDGDVQADHHPDCLWLEVCEALERALQ